MKRPIEMILNRIAAAEAALQSVQFLAPCVRGGQVRAKVAGLVQTFLPRPHDFEGWGLFRPAGPRIAELEEEANLPLVADYLRLFPVLRLRLIRPLEGQTWLAYPGNESDARQRLGMARPLPVHLVTDGGVFEPITARGDGNVWWFEDGDRRADPMPADRMRDALRQTILPQALQFSGLTPEMRTAYDLAAQQEPAFQALREQQQEEARRQAAERQQRRAQQAQEGQHNARPALQGQPGETRRLRTALRLGGGELYDYRDRGDYWQVEWTTRDGSRHVSAISKNDLTVISSGICLSGRDHDFDLQSLVGVIERR